MSDGRVSIRSYIPGDAGYICYMHMKFYGKQYRFKPVFEYYVMSGLSEFLRDPRGGNLWVAECGGLIVGSAAVVKTPDAAQFRWFLVEDGYQGRGIGKKLLDTAMRFCAEQGYERVYLWTVSNLDSARGLYSKAGFVLTEEKSNDDWTDGVITEERWELNTL